MAKTTQAQRIDTLEGSMTQMMELMNQLVQQGNAVASGHRPTAAPASEMPPAVIEDDEDEATFGATSLKAENRKPFIEDVVRRTKLKGFTLGSTPTEDGYTTEPSAGKVNGRKATIVRLGGTSLVQCGNGEVHLTIASKDHNEVGISKVTQGSHRDPHKQFNAGLSFAVNTETIHALRQIADQLEELNGRINAK